MADTYVQKVIKDVDVSGVLNKHTGEMLAKPEIGNKPIQSLKNIAGALAKAQLEMKNPALNKENPYYHSKYASLAAVRDASIPILAKHGIATMQLLSNASNGDIICTTTLLHTSGEFITSDLVLPATKKDAQGLGAASTYARRYALQAIVGIVGEDDDDGNQAVSAGKQSAQEKTPTAEAQKHKQELSNAIDGNKIITSIKNITSKPGVGKDKKDKDGNVVPGKPYTIYTIYGDGDAKYSTFDKALADGAKTAKDAGLQVSIVTKGDKYNSILSLDLVDPDYSIKGLDGNDLHALPDSQDVEEQDIPF